VAKAISSEGLPAKQYILEEASKVGQPGDVCVAMRADTDSRLDLLMAFVATFLRRGTVFPLSGDGRQCRSRLAWSGLRVVNGRGTGAGVRARAQDIQDCIFRQLIRRKLGNRHRCLALRTKPLFAASLSLTFSLCPFGQTTSIDIAMFLQPRDSRGRRFRCLPSLMPCLPLQLLDLGHLPYQLPDNINAPVPTIGSCNLQRDYTNSTIITHRTRN